MFEIDKEKLGAFIAQLRKEKGYTQKELAEKLYISNKAISKWETGASMPDTSLLIPLADLLGVTVTELLTCQRMTSSISMDNNEVENLVKAAITYTEEEQVKETQLRKQHTMAYLICLLISSIETIVLYFMANVTSSQFIFLGLTAFIGGYFCMFAKQKLPTYYDENKISIYSDGPFRMNMPGISFNNSNWPHVLQAARGWTLVSLISYPILCSLAALFLPENMVWIQNQGFVLLYLAGLFIPIYIVGKKYQ